MEIENQTFQSQDYTGKSFAGQSYIQCVFRNCHFDQCLFHNTRFVSCSFQTCNFSLVKWDGCRLQDVLFTDSKISGAEFFKCEKKFFSMQAQKCFLQYCNFADLSMKKASFRGSKLKECHFTGTLLTEADFRDSNLEGTLFHHCDLSKADFIGASHYGLDVRVNQVKGAKFSLPEAMELLQVFDVRIE